MILPYLDASTSRQTNSLHEALLLISGMPGDDELSLLDLGCGAGTSFEQFTRNAPRVRWTGVDIEDSPEAKGRIRTDLNVAVYDGVGLPQASGSVDVVYSRQVFEHVRHPQELIQEVYRVLKTGGYFVGSTSQLEPFHSRSLWNYTPYGFAQLLETSGFASVDLRPGIDGFTLMGRRLLGFLGWGDFLNLFFRWESPLNFLIEIGGRIARFSPARRKTMKLLFAGHFIFTARK